MSAFLASALLVPNTKTLLWENTDDEAFTVYIRMANDNAGAIRYWVAIGQGAYAARKDCITPNVKVGGYEPWEDTGQRISPGEKVWVMATKDNVSVRVFGVRD